MACSGLSNPAHGTVTINCTWSTPPASLEVEKDVTLTANCQGTASQGGGEGYRNLGGSVTLKYTEAPPDDCLACITYGTTDILFVEAGGSTTDYPVSGSDEGSFTVPVGQPGDVLVIVASGHEPGGRGHIVYKYVYAPGRAEQ